MSENDSADLPGTGSDDGYAGIREMLAGFIVARLRGDSQTFPWPPAVTQSPHKEKALQYLLEGIDRDCDMSPYVSLRPVTEGYDRNKLESATRIEASPDSVDLELMSIVYYFSAIDQPEKAEAILPFFCDKYQWCTAFSRCIDAWTARKKARAVARRLHYFSEQIDAFLENKDLTPFRASQHLAFINKFACAVGDLPLSWNCIRRISPKEFRQREKIRAAVAFQHRLSLPYQEVHDRLSSPTEPPQPQSPIPSPAFVTYRIPGRTSA